MYAALVSLTQLTFLPQEILGRSLSYFALPEDLSQGEKETYAKLKKIVYLRGIFVKANWQPGLNGVLDGDGLMRTQVHGGE